MENVSISNFNIILHVTESICQTSNKRSKWRPNHQSVKCANTSERAKNVLIVNAFHMLNKTYIIVDNYCI